MLNPDLRCLRARRNHEKNRAKKRAHYNVFKMCFLGDARALFLYNKGIAQKMLRKRAKQYRRRAYDPQSFHAGTGRT